MQNIVLGRDLLPRDFRPHSMQILINYIRLRLIQSRSHSPAFTGTTWGLCQKRSAHTGVCHVDIITAVVWSNVKFPLANRSRSLNIYLMGSFDVMLVRGKKLFRSHSPIKFHIAILRIPACFPFFGVLFPRNRLRWQNISENLGIVKITKLIHWTFFFGGFLLLSLAVKGIISSFHCRFWHHSVFAWPIRGNYSFQRPFQTVFDMFMYHAHNTLTLTPSTNGYDAPLKVKFTTIKHAICTHSHTHKH